MQGLTWEEIDSCEKLYCTVLTLECPTKDNFEEYDLDADGNLTLEEYMEVYNWVREQA